jgi:hypothetical protein
MNRYNLNRQGKIKKLKLLVSADKDTPEKARKKCPCGALSVLGGKPGNGGGPEAPCYPPVLLVIK